MKFSLARLAVFVLAATLMGCAADRLHHDGLAALDRGDYETGIAKLSEASKTDPNNLVYRMDLLTRTERTVQALVAKGDAARGSGDLATAEAAYRRVLSIEPGNARAKSGIELVRADARHAERIQHAQKLLDAKKVDDADVEVRAVLEEDAAFGPAMTLATKIQAARGTVTPVPQLKTRDSRAVTLQFRDAPTKMVFEVLARQTGLNFIFDKDIKSDGKTTIFVSQVPVESAIDLILAQNQLARQILSDNMILIYAATPAKQKEYQEEIVRTFYLANAAPKDVENMLKTVLGAKTLFVDERSNTVVLRDTPEHVRMAEKLVASIDVPESEVILEVEVLEAAHTLLDQLGIQYPSSATLSPTALAGATGATTATNALHLNDLLNQNRNTITVTPLSVGVNFLKTTGQTNTLSSPRIRAKNKEKAKILVGDRVPVVTSGSASAGGTSNVFSTSSVQYLEVGLNLEVTPTIHVDGNVQIKLALEVSSIVKEIDVATGPGSSTHVYQIGTRNTNTTLELKDGETQVLAGLITDSDQRSSSHIPGLGDMPILGRLFGSKSTTKDKNEIILSITPHIIRAQTRPGSDTTEFWYGTESQTRSAPFTTSRASDAPTVGGPAVPGGVSTMSGPSAATSASIPSAPRAVPTRIEAAAAMPASAGAGDAEAGASAATRDASTPAADGKAHVSIDGPATAKVGDEIGVSVRLDGGTDIGKVRTQVRFDASALQLVSAEAGDLGQGSNPKVDSRAGGVQVEFGGDAPIAGGGSLVNMRFKVVAVRPAISVSTQVVLVGEDGAAVAASQATPLSIASTQ